MKNLLTDNYQLDRQKLVTIVSGLLGANPDPDNPPPHGPWDPYIHKAAVRTSLGFTNAHPGEEDPHYPPRPPFSLSEFINVWNVLYRYELTTPYANVYLNPQPLPPGIAFARSLAREIIDQAGVISDISGTNGKESNGSAAAFVLRFTEDLCPIPAKVPFPPGKKPVPGPGPQPWGAVELAAVAVEFQQAALHADRQEIKDALIEAGDRILDAAIDRW